MFSRFHSLFCDCISANIKIGAPFKSLNQKAEEFIGNDLHKVRIKSVRLHSFASSMRNEEINRMSERAGARERKERGRMREQERRKKSSLYKSIAMKFIFQTVLCNFIEGWRWRKRANGMKFTFLRESNIGDHSVYGMHTKSVCFWTCKTVSIGLDWMKKKKKKRWIIEARIELLAGAQKQTENQWNFYMNVQHADDDHFQAGTNTQK